VPQEFDVIVIGGGINGLTAAAYLAKTGLSVCVMERAGKPGQHAVTEEWCIPGWRLSTHATSIWTGHSPCMLDLELERFGLNLTIPRYSRGYPTLDGVGLVADTWDVNNIYKKWAKLSERDAKTYAKLMNKVYPVREEFIEKLLYREPTAENMDWLVKFVGDLCGIEDWYDMNGFAWLDEMFENPYIKGYLAAFAHSSQFLPSERFVGALGALMVATAISNQQSIGGPGQIPKALTRCIIYHGGVVWVGCQVDKILIKDGVAIGVKLSDDRSPNAEKVVYARKAIVSNLSPVPTFLHLVGEEHLDKNVVTFLRYNFDYNMNVIYKAFFLTREPPRWACASHDADILKAWNFNFGADTVDEVMRVEAELSANRIPKPIACLGANFVLTFHDSTCAPPGYHYVQFWSDVPFKPAGWSSPERWDDEKWNVLDTLVDRINEYAPNFKASIVEREVSTPLDTWRRNPSAIHGQVGGGTLMRGQAYIDRPFLGCNPPRTPIKRLYLSNGIWPSGFTLLASGYIAANAVIEDLGIKKPDWWVNKPLQWFRVWAERNKVVMNSRVTVD